MTRKICADNIFTGTELTGPGHVLLFSEEGIIDSIAPLAEAGEGVEFISGIICPGFVNAHCHIELSHLKNKIPQHTGLVDFVQSVMTGRAASDEEKQEAMQQAERELYESGTVAVGDICNTTDSIPLKNNSKLYWHNFIEVSGFVDAGAQKRFDDAKKVAAVFEKEIVDQPPTGLEAAVGVNKIPVGITPHAPYSVSKKLFELINDEKGNLISIHNQESRAEDELYKSKSGDFLRLYQNFGIDISSFQATGKSSFASWLRYITNGQKIISVHNTFTDTEDIANSKFKIQNSKLFFCLCPNANLYIENVLPPIEMLMENNCNIILGTDSYASNTSLNIFEEIKTIQKNFPLINLGAILRWATLNGATALGIADRYGSFEKGKQPGIILIEDKNAKRLY